MTTWTDDEVKAHAERLGLPVPEEQLAALATAVRRNAEMIANNRTIVGDELTPVLFIAPARRPARDA